MAQRDSRVASRDFGLWIVGVEIDVGEDSRIRIPASDLRFIVTQGKLFAAGATLFDH